MRRIERTREHRIFSAITALLFSAALSNGGNGPTNGEFARAFNSIVESTQARQATSEKITLPNGENARILSAQFKSEFAAFKGELIKSFNVTNALNFNRCVAAHFLGELRASEAAELLATNITLKHNPNEAFQMKVTFIDLLPAQLALIQIGQPAVRPLIQNLESTDEPEAYRLSLETLLIIEEDKDVVRLLLQKALAVQADEAKKNRLKLAVGKLETAEIHRKSPWIKQP